MPRDLLANIDMPANAGPRDLLAEPAPNPSTPSPAAPAAQGTWMHRQLGENYENLPGGVKSLINLPGSSIGVIKDLGSAAYHFTDTIVGMKNLIGGLEGLAGEKAGLPMKASLDEAKTAQAFIDKLKSDYGSIDNAKRTLEENPAQFLLDVTSAISGVGAAKRAVVGGAAKTGVAASSWASPTTQVLESWASKEMPGFKLDVVQRAQPELGKTAAGTIKNIVAESYTGHPVIEAFNKGNEVAINKFMDSFIADYGNVQGKADLGQLLTDTINKNFTAAKIPASAMFDEVKTATASKPVIDPTSGITAYRGGASIDLSAAKIDAGELQSLSARVGLPPDNAMVNRVVASDGFVDFESAQKLRSELGDAWYAAKRVGDGDAARQLKLMQVNVDKGIESGLGKFDKANDTNILGKWQDARSEWHSVSEKYNNEFIQRIMKAAQNSGEPEKAINSVFKANGQSGIEKVREALGEENFGDFQAHLAGRLFTKAGRAVEPVLDAAGNVVEGAAPASAQNIDGAKLLNELASPDGFGSDAIKSALGKEGYNTLAKAAKLIAISQEKTGATPWSLAVKTAQTGALAGGMYAAHGDLLLSMGAAGTVLLAPPVIGALMTNPKWVSAIGTFVKSGSDASVFAAYDMMHRTNYAFEKRNAKENSK